MKKIILAVSMLLAFTVSPAIAEDTPLPKDGVFSNATLVAGGFKLDKDMYCHHTNAWRNMPENKMKPVSGGMACPSLQPGEHFHPFQSGVYLKVETAHTGLFGKLQSNEHVSGLAYDGNNNPQYVKE